MSKLSPFAKGQLAYTAGTPISCNPHTFHNDAWYKWYKGWQSAQSAARKAADKAQREAIEARPLPQWAQMEEAENG